MAINITNPSDAIDEANELFSGLSIGLPDLPDFPEPPEIVIEDLGELPSDLTQVIEVPDVEDLTQGAVAGSGVFDKIMSALNSHIESQYHKNIIGQADIAAVYIAAIQATLPQSIHFMLTSQQSYWQAKLVQIQAQNMWLERARLDAELQTAKLVAYKAQAEAYTSQVQALTAQTTYTNQKLQLVSTLQAINSAETNEAISQANYDAAYVQTHNTLPGGGTIQGLLAKDMELKTEQISLSQKQQELIDAQVNVQHAQTYDTNIDLTPVGGIIGVQKALYTQQIDSYVADGKNKGVKLIADLWTSAKALDDSVQMPGPIPGNLMMAMNTYLNEIGLPNAMTSADAPATGVPSDDTDWNEPGNQA